MRTLILFLCSLVLFSCSTKPTKPDVLVILVDDLGWGDIGYNNPEHVYTPNLDKLASQSALLGQHYVMPQCTPTRIATFTGRYPGRFGNEGLNATNEQVFPIGTPTLATMFKAEGYKTRLVGKWHMGSDTINGPNNHGFDTSYGALAGAVGAYDHRYRDGKYENAWHRNHKPLPNHENGVHVTDLLADDAIRIIKSDDDDPMFMYLAFLAPHTPLDERGSFVDQPTKLDSATNSWINEGNINWFDDPEGKIQAEDDPEKRLLLAVVNHLDNAIGRVISALEESGKLDNTIILFSSDNGPQVNWGGNAYPDDLRLTNFNQQIPMRGSKTDVWEGGIHVPGFIYWKDKITPKVIDDPVHIIDWYPTLANIINHKESANYKLDGENIGPLLFKNEKLPIRDLYWIWNKNTNRWALHYDSWKIVKYGREEPANPSDWQLFNLHEDPKETTDISAQNPEKLSELHGLFLKQRRRDLGNTINN